MIKTPKTSRNFQAATFNFSYFFPISLMFTLKTFANLLINSKNKTRRKTQWKTKKVKHKFSSKFWMSKTRYLSSCPSHPCQSSTANNCLSAAKWKDSSRRKCFDCKHCIDAVAADTLVGWAIESNFDFYRRSAAAVDRRSTACRSTDSADLIRDVDKSARCVICRNHSAVAVPAPLAVAVVVRAAGFVIYLALCGRWVGREVRRS